MTSVEPVPESFLAKVLNEFGLQWAHIAVFSGLIFSSFGLEKYLNAGAWMVTTIASFAIVFLFRREVSSKFPIVVPICVAASTLLLVAGVMVASRISTGLPHFMETHRLESTVYVGLSTMLPLAVIILSYRSREDLYAGRFPLEISDAIRSNLASLSFYKRNQLYEFVVLEVDRTGVKVRLVLAYTLFNRTGAIQRMPLTLTPMREKMEFISARIDNRELDVDDPAFRSEAGLSIMWPFSPGQGHPVRLEAHIWYRHSDCDLMASYLPATDFTLIVTNPFRDLRIVVESLFREVIQPDIQGDTRIYKSPGGTIPYQGFKLDWMPR